MTRDFELTHGDATLSVLGSRGVIPVWGWEGGLPALGSGLVYDAGGPDEFEVGVMRSGVHARQGRTIRFWEGGGGGWQDPRTRPAEWVLEDVIDGFVSIEAARDALRRRRLGDRRGRGPLRDRRGGDRAAQSLVEAGRHPRFLRERQSRISSVSGRDLPVVAVVVHDHGLGLGGQAAVAHRDHALGRRHARASRRACSAARRPRGRRPGSSGER